MADVALSSTRNPRVRAAAALRDRRARNEAGLTLIDGARELARAVAGGAAVVEVYVDRGRLGPEGDAAIQAAAASGAEILEVSDVVVDRLAYGDRGDGIVAVARIPDMSLAALRLPPEPLVVVVEGVEKPGNLGAVLRSADGAGADAVIAADPRTDLFNPNAVRASQGTLFAVPVAAAPTTEVRAWLREAGIRVLAARVGASVPYARSRPPWRGRDRARQRGQRPDRRLDGRRDRHRPADAGGRRQPERLDHRGRAAL